MTSSFLSIPCFRFRAIRWLAPALILFMVSVLIPPPRAQAGTTLDLTAEERAWLAEHDTLTLGVGVAFPPFMYVEEENGRPVFKGMVSDYIALLEQRLGVSMEPVLDISFQEALNQARQQQIDLFPCIAKTPEREEFLVYTKSYLSYPLVIINREDSPFIGSMEDLHGKKVSVVKELANYSKYVNDLPHIDMEFVFKPDIPAVLEAVAMGEADACVSNLAVAGHFIAQNGWTNLRIAAPTPWATNDLAMAVRSDWPMLASILQKGLDSITPEERQAIAQSWIKPNMDRFPDWRYYLKIGLPFFLLLLAILAMTLVWNRKLKKEVDQRKQAETTARKEKERAQLYLDLAGVMFLIIGRDECVHLINKKGCATLETDEADIIGKNWFDTFIPPPFRNSVKETFQLLLAGEIEPVEYAENPILTSAGSEKLIAWHNAVIRDESGQILGTLSSGEDITARKRMEETMIQTEKMLSVGGLAAGMAHEINNPLASILGNAQVVIQRLSPDLPKNKRVAREAGLDFQALDTYMQNRGVKNMLTAIHESGKRAAKIVSDMLGFSRETESDFAMQDLAGLLDKTVELAASDYNLKKKYDFRNIQIIRRYEENLPLVCCDAGQLQQVFLNILTNGAHAMANKCSSQKETYSPCFTLSLSSAQETILVEIEDNGPGMEESVRKKVFEPFFTTKEVDVGTGLGMSVAFFIITRNHGGTIYVDSVPEKGSTFTIRLPLHQDMAP